MKWTVRCLWVKKKKRESQQVCVYEAERVKYYIYRFQLDSICYILDSVGAPNQEITVFKSWQQINQSGGDGFSLNTQYLIKNQFISNNHNVVGDWCRSQLELTDEKRDSFPGRSKVFWPHFSLQVVIIMLFEASIELSLKYCWSLFVRWSE